MHNGTIDNDVVFMFPMMSKIVCNTYNDSYSIMNRLIKLQLNKPVSRLFPLVQQPNSYVKLDKTPRVMIMGCEDPRFDFNYIKTDQNFDVLVYGGDNIDFILTQMARGVIVIVKDTPKFGEFIINGINGIAINNFNKADISYANRMFIRDNAITFCDKYLSEWYDKFMLTVIDETLNEMDFSVLDFNTRFWVILKTSLVDSKEVIDLPKERDLSFISADVYDIEEIVHFFSQQKFSEVVIFDWHYGEDDFNKISRTLDTVTSFGSRAINIFWVTDDKIDDRWKGVFDRMTILSVSEGCKRVKHRS